MDHPEAGQDPQTQREGGAKTARRKDLTMELTKETLSGQRGASHLMRRSQVQSHPADVLTCRMRHKHVCVEKCTLTMRPDGRSSW